MSEPGDDTRDTAVGAVYSEIVRTWPFVAQSADAPYIVAFANGTKLLLEALVEKSAATGEGNFTLEL